jgi:hypothetical protein
MRANCARVASRDNLPAEDSPVQRIAFGLVVALLLGVSSQSQTRNGATGNEREAAAAELTVQPVPAELARRTQSFHAALKPAAATWVEEQAKSEASESTPDLDELRDAIRKRFASSLAGGGHPAGPGGNMDVEALVLMVMMEAAQDEDQDLQAQMQQMQAMTKAKDQIRALLNEMSQPMSALAGSPRGDVCESAFCRSLPVKLAAINTATANLPHPSHLAVPDKVTAEDVANAQAALQNDLDSDNELSQMTQMQLQMLMDRRSKMLEAASNIEKTMSDTDAAIVSNLK